MQYNAVKISQSLSLSLSNSVANQPSNYVIEFGSRNLPIRSNLTILLNSLHKINGGCFIVNNFTGLGFGMNCNVLNSSAISITYEGDCTPMMINNIWYSITIRNILNPPSIIPLLYSFTSQEDSTTSQ
jgi:hypothetical protein